MPTPATQLAKAETVAILMADQATKGDEEGASCRRRAAGAAVPDRGRIGVPCAVKVRSCVAGSIRLMASVSQQHGGSQRLLQDRALPKSSGAARAALRNSEREEEERKNDGERDSRVPTSFFCSPSI